MKSLLTLVLLACSAPLLAQSNAADSAYEHAYATCLKQKGPTNNSVVMDCSERVSQRALTDIARFSKLIVAQVSPEDAARFKRSQQNWVNYRDVHCDLAGTYIGSPMYSYCPMKLNAARAFELGEMAGE